MKTVLHWCIIDPSIEIKQSKIEPRYIFNGRTYLSFILYYNDHNYCCCMTIILFSSGCLTGSWSVWSHTVTPHSTIYHLVFVI